MIESSANANGQKNRAFIGITRCGTNSDFILIVDDDADFTEFLSTWIHCNRVDLNVLTAWSGVEALNLVRRYKPRLVFLDLHMRGWNGVKTCSMIRESAPEVQIIGLTGSSDHEARKAMLAAGADQIVSKSASAMSILFLLNRFLLKTENREEFAFSAHDGHTRRCSRLRIER